MFLCGCRYAEKLLVFMFVLLVLLWLFREPRFIKGWGVIFKEQEGKMCVREKWDPHALL